MKKAAKQVNRSSIAFLLKEARRQIRQYQEMNYKRNGEIFNYMLDMLHGWVSGWWLAGLIRQKALQPCTPWMRLRSQPPRKEAAHEETVADAVV